MAVPLLLVRQIVRHREQFAQSDEPGDNAATRRAYIACSFPLGTDVVAQVAARLHDFNGYQRHGGEGVDWLACVNWAI
jgi:hypothetical protein